MRHPITLVDIRYFGIFFSYLCGAPAGADADDGVGPAPVDDALLLLLCSYAAAAGFDLVMDVVGLCLDIIPFVVAVVFNIGT